jgi:hypothetical protein
MNYNNVRECNSIIEMIDTELLEKASQWLHIAKWIHIFSEEVVA